jgi:hypothetical protein
MYDLSEPVPIYRDPSLPTESARPYDGSAKGGQALTGLPKGKENLAIIDPLPPPGEGTGEGAVCRFTFYD